MRSHTSDSSLCVRGMALRFVISDLWFLVFIYSLLLHLRINILAVAFVSEWFLTADESQSCLCVIHLYLSDCMKYYRHCLCLIAFAFVLK